jgi:hypothetical protein
MHGLKGSHLEGVQHDGHCKEGRIAHVASFQHGEYANVQP